MHSHDFTHMYFHDQSRALTYTHDHTHPHSLTFLHTHSCSLMHMDLGPHCHDHTLIHTHTHRHISLSRLHIDITNSHDCTLTQSVVWIHMPPPTIFYFVSAHTPVPTHTFVATCNAHFLLCLRFSGQLCVLWIFHTPAPDSTAFWFLITPWTVVLCYVVAPYFTDWATRVDWGHICVNQWLWLAEDG